MPQLVSPYRLHVLKWQNGCGNGICDSAVKKCFVRGTVPCDVLFVGEAPGESENVLGEPFVGPAGKLIDRIILEAFTWTSFSHALTNLVCCIPRDEDGNKATEPVSDEIENCRPRLNELMKLCKPRMLVCVGQLSKEFVLGLRPRQSLINQIDWLPRGKTLQLVDIVHPAAILRANYAQQGFMIRKAIVTLSNALEDLRAAYS